MKFNTSAFHFLAFVFAGLFAGLLVVGCDSAGTSSEDPPPDEIPDDKGAVSFSLRRTADSDIPSDADSALVRLWRPDGNFNVVEVAVIPDPGQQTKVSLIADTASGYRAGLLAVRSTSEFPKFKTVLAHGSSDRFTVQSDTSRVRLSIRPAEFTLEVPESLGPDEIDTIEAISQINPPNTEQSIELAQGDSSNFEFSNGSQIDPISGAVTETDTTVSQSFEIEAPDVDSEDTTYVKALVSIDDADDMSDGGAWTTDEQTLGGIAFPSGFVPSFEIPVVPGANDDKGTVIIVFSRDGDGWEETRRTIE